jgi:CDP-4-dehydro-6-deoxyglucose reductase
MPSKKEVPCLPNQSVLGALETAGLFLPNNCRAGACGECKVKVLKGTIDQGFILDMALTDQEKKDGYGLMCMAKIQSEELELSWENETDPTKAGPRLFPPQENRPFMVIEKTPLTGTIVKLRCRPLGEKMRFWPGQFVRLGHPESSVKSKSYSIANINNPEGDIILYVTRVDGGKTSGWIHEKLNIGDKIHLDGPYGTFIGDPTLQNPVLCLAAGSGLAPLSSLATGALTLGGFKFPATLIFSARTPQDLIDVGHFRFLETKYRNFRFMATYTEKPFDPTEQHHHPALKPSQELKGRIPQILPTLYSDLSDTTIFIAGSVDFVKSCQDTLVEKLKARPQNIMTEGFINQFN